MIDRAIAMLVIGLSLGGGIGFTIAAGQGITLDGHDHAAAAAHAGRVAGAHDASHGEPLALAAGPDAPTVEITVEPDAHAGWNLRVTATNFRFAPTHASGPHVPGEGHAHVYVEGRKVARLYGHWLHLADLPPGTPTVRVTLNANDHRPLAVEGRLVADAVSVPVE